MPRSNTPSLEQQEVPNSQVPPLPPLPTETTAPKYPMPSMVTPIPRLPKESDSAKAFGQGAVATAILGVIFSAIKEMGGIPVALSWLKGLTLATWIVLAIVLAIVSIFLYGRQVLGLMQARMVEHDQHIVAGVNRLAMQQAMQGESIEQIVADVGELREAVADLADSIKPEPASQRTQPNPRRSGAHGIVSDAIEADDTPQESPTGRQRRLAPR